MENKRKLTKKAPVRKLTVEKVRKAIDGSQGSITEIARRCKVSRLSIYNFMERYPTLKEEITQEKEIVLDANEDRLQEIALLGDIKDSTTLSAVKFYLSTKGKKRGYVEKQEIEHSGTDMKIQINIPKEVKDLITESNDYGKFKGDEE